MSWLVARKSGKKTIAWEYRWKDRGLTRSRSTGTANKAEALKIQKKWDAAATLNIPAAFEERNHNGVCIAEQLEIYLREKKVEVKPGTYRRYEFHSRFLLDFFRRNQIRFFDQLNPVLMRSYKAERLEQGRSQKTIFEELAFFRGLVRRLVEEESLERDPVRVWPKLQKRIPARPETLGYYRADEIGRILGYFEGLPLYDFILAAFCTGARHGELKNLRAWDIDMAAGIIRFMNEKTVTSYTNVHKFLPIHEMLKPMLQKKIGEVSPDSWVFPEVHDHWEAWPRHELQKACKVLGTQYKRFHGTRHSFGTLMLETGATITEISHALGHTNLTTTQRYSHMRQSAQKRSISCSFM